MRAAVIHEHGGVECIRVEDVPDPEPAAGEALLEVRAAALNHLDIWVRRGGPAKLAMPHVLGSDAAGVVAAIGPDATGAAVGDEVVLNPGVDAETDEFTQAGQHSLSPGFGLVGLSRPGTHAERVAVPAECLRPKPAHLSFEEAAALPLAHLTAWRMLMGRAAVRPGETVLIHGIGGGVALAALQLAKLSHAEVIATSSSNKKLRTAQHLGADHTVNYAECPDVGGAVREITSGRGVDVAIDTVGAATWATNFAAVRKGGRIVHCGVTSGAKTQVDLQALYWNQFTILGSTLGSRSEFRQMLRAVSAARLKPVIDSVFGLDDIRRATARMEAGEQFGKIVIQVAG